MRLVSKSGTDVNLVGLFSIYKDFEPSMVMTIVPPARKAIFKVYIDIHNRTISKYSGDVD
jgi:hypothetical protein